MNDNKNNNEFAIVEMENTFFFIVVCMCATLLVVVMGHITTISFIINYCVETKQRKLKNSRSANTKKHPQLYMRMKCELKNLFLQNQIISFLISKKNVFNIHFFFLLFLFPPHALLFILFKLCLFCFTDIELSHEIRRTVVSDSNIPIK